MFLACALAGVIAFTVLLARLPWPVGLLYGGMGALSFVLYRADKDRAMAGHWRISEATLLGVDVCFGIVGGLFGQALFRHKTSKHRYRAVVLVIAAVHLIGLVAFASGQLDLTELQRGVAGLPRAGG